MAPPAPTDEIKTLLESYKKAAQGLSIITEDEKFILEVHECWECLGVDTYIHKYESLSKRAHFAVFLTLNAAKKYMKAYCAHLGIPTEGIQDYLDENNDFLVEVMEVIDDVLGPV